MLPRNPKHSQNFFDFLVLARYISRCVRVLNTQDKVLPALFSAKIVENRRTQVAYVHITRWRWRKSIHLPCPFLNLKPF